MVVEIQKKACDRCKKQKKKCNKLTPCDQCDKRDLQCTYSVAIKEYNGVLYDLTSCNKMKERVISSICLNKDYSIYSLIDTINKDFSQLSILSYRNSKLLMHSNGIYKYYGNSAVISIISSSKVLMSISSSIPLNRMDVNLGVIQCNRDINLNPHSNIVQSLIELHFNKVNIFQPLIHRGRFYDMYKNPKKSYSFLTLLYCVCLSGSSYFPDVSLIPILGRKLSLVIQKLHYLNTNKYNICTLQYLILLSKLIAIDDRDFSIKCAYGFHCLARNIAISLGLHKFNNNLSLDEREIRNRIFWYNFNNDICYSLSTSRPINNDFNTVFVFNPNIYLFYGDYEDYDLFFGFHSSMAFNFLIYYILLSKHFLLVLSFNQLRNEFPEFFETIQYKRTKRQISYTLKKEKIERGFQDWYCSFPDDVILQNPCVFMQDLNNFHSCLLHMHYFSILIEINRPFVNENSTFDLRNYLTFDNIDFKNLSFFSEAERCFILAHFGARIIENNLKMLLEYGSIYKWWNALNFAIVYVQFFKFYSNFGFKNEMIRDLNIIKKFTEAGAGRFVFARDVHLNIVRMCKAVVK